MTYSIYEIILSRLIINKPRLHDNLMFEKTFKLLDIWETQSKLIYLTNSYDDPHFIYERLICSSYDELLLKNDLIFIEEVSEPVIMLNLIYYWVIMQIKRDREKIYSGM